MTEPLVEETMRDEEAPQSPLEALRVRRNEVASNREVFIQIAAYEEMGLKAKYRLLDRDETDGIAKAVRKQTRERSDFMYLVVVDTTIRACEGFYLAPNGVSDEQAKPLEDVEGKPITTYLGLARALGWEPPAENAGNRAAALWVFHDNEFALGNHGLMLQRWLNNTNVEVDEEFLGD